MCDARIRPGDSYHAQTNLYDGMVYDWRECLTCHEDGIVNIVSYYCGWPDEGVGFEQAMAWAEDAIDWHGVKAAERFAAADWLARATTSEMAGAA